MFIGSKAQIYTETDISFHAAYVQTVHAVH